MKIVSDIKSENSLLGLDWEMNTDGAQIYFKSDNNNDEDSYLHFVTKDDGNEYFKFSNYRYTSNQMEEWASIKEDGLRVKGNKVYNEGFKPSPTDIGAAPTIHTHNSIVHTDGVVANNLIKEIGLSHNNIYSDGSVFDYGNTINIKDINGGMNQIALEWSGTNKAPGRMFIRNKRDMCNEWSDFDQVYTHAFKPTAKDIGAAPTLHYHNIQLTDDEDGDFDISTTGFKRPNSAQVNGSNISYNGLAIHISHPNYSNGEYSRGIGFDYGSSGTNLCTYAFDDKGNFNGSTNIYTEDFPPTAEVVGAAPTVHYHTELVGVNDNRHVDESPQDRDAGLYIDFKEAGVNKINVGDFDGVITFRPWGTSTDFSGGPAHQLAFSTDGNMFKRTGSNDHWDKWGQIYNQNHDVNLGEGTRVLSQFNLGMDTWNKDNSGSYSLIKGVGDNDIQIGTQNQHLEIKGSLGIDTNVSTGIRLNGNNKNFIVTTEALNEDSTFIGISSPGDNNITLGFDMNTKTNTVNLIDQYGSSIIYTDKTIPIFNPIRTQYNGTYIYNDGIIKSKNGISDIDFKIRIHNAKENGYGELTGHSGYIESTSELRMAQNTSLYVSNENGILSKMSDGTYDNMIKINHNNDMILGRGENNRSIYANYGRIYINGKQVSTEADPDALWTGCVLLNSKQSLNPKKALNNCKNGWMLMWCNYDSSQDKANDWNYSYTYIHKNQKQNVYTYDVLPMGRNDKFCTKAYFFDNNTLTGYDQNGTQWTSLNKALVGIYEW